MKRNVLTISLAIFLVGSILFPNISNAVTITYEAVDLADESSGQDLWQYSYALDEFPFVAGAGFTIYFDVGLYAALEDPVPFVNDSWDPLVLQPDLVIPDDGTYDAMALDPNPSVQDPFIVSFVWLGEGIPGAQPFEIYDIDFAVVEKGVTSAGGQPAPVPEPSTILLIGMGLVGLGGIKRWRQ